MGFSDGKGVAFQPCEFRSEAEELLHSDGEVGSIKQCSTRLMASLHVSQMGVPAGGADDNAAAEGQDGAHILNGSFRVCEVDDHVDAGSAER